ncbi:MAG: hypothetical protein AMJ67_01570 [Betaproteobacteria bacterium SG8_41]|jgi:hypothetical protein|nr:MAG: hypothetical protein AMJ67_01570 [Betaproteobacteria bacterium SG8_41]
MRRRYATTRLSAGLRHSVTCGAAKRQVMACVIIIRGIKSRGAAIDMLNARVSQAKRIVLWLVLGALAALLTYIAFRGYLSPELLINFSNAFRC